MSQGVFRLGSLYDNLIPISLKWYSLLWDGALKSFLVRICVQKEEESTYYLLASHRESHAGNGLNSFKQ